MISFSKSLCHGKGLIATEDIKNKQDIHVTHIWDYEHKMWVNIKPNCMYNHSKEKENCEINTRQDLKILVASKNIESGKELFVDYTKDKDLEQPEEDWKE
tara:strand:+ start:1896 stop:2195 length:300 start_codon:yes stop_codon:yes gene_type:complete